MCPQTAPLGAITLSHGNPNDQNPQRNAVPQYYTRPSTLLCRISPRVYICFHQALPNSRSVCTESPMVEPPRKNVAARSLLVPTPNSVRVATRCQKLKMNKRRQAEPSAAGMLTFMLHVYTPQHNVQTMCSRTRYMPGRAYYAVVCYLSRVRQTSTGMLTNRCRTGRSQPTPNRAKASNNYTPDQDRTGDLHRVRLTS